MIDRPDEPEFLFADLGQTMHESLHTICRHLPTDFEPYGKRVRTGPDCSYGCRHFLKLPGDLAYDWGGVYQRTQPAFGVIDVRASGLRVL